MEKVFTLLPIRLSSLRCVDSVETDWNDCIGVMIGNGDSITIVNCHKVASEVMTLCHNSALGTCQDEEADPHRIVQEQVSAYFLHPLNHLILDLVMCCMWNGLLRNNSPANSGRHSEMEEIAVERG